MLDRDTLSDTITAAKSQLANTISHPMHELMQLSSDVVTNNRFHRFFRDDLDGARHHFVRLQTAYETFNKHFVFNDKMGESQDVPEALSNALQRAKLASDEAQQHYQAILDGIVTEKDALKDKNQQLEDIIRRKRSCLMIENVTARQLREEKSQQYIEKKITSTSLEARNRLEKSYQPLFSEKQQRKNSEVEIKGLVEEQKEIRIKLAYYDEMLTKRLQAAEKLCMTRKRHLLVKQIELKRQWQRHCAALSLPIVLHAIHFYHSFILFKASIEKKYTACQQQNKIPKRLQLLSDALTRMQTIFDKQMAMIWSPEINHLSAAQIYSSFVTLSEQDKKLFMNAQQLDELKAIMKINEAPISRLALVENQHRAVV